MDWSTSLSVLATAAMIAVPGLRTFVHETQRCSVVNEIQLEIRKASRAADQLGRTVTLCASGRDGTSCAADGNWSGGWLAFVDVDDDGAMDPGEARLQLWQTRTAHENIRISAEPAVLSFRPFYVRPNAQGSTAGHVTVCDRAGHGGTRTILVERGGIPQLAPATPEVRGCG